MNPSTRPASASAATCTSTSDSASDATSDSASSVSAPLAVSIPTPVPAAPPAIFVTPASDVAPPPAATPLTTPLLPLFSYDEDGVDDCEESDDRDRPVAVKAPRGSASYRLDSPKVVQVVDDDLSDKERVPEKRKRDRSPQGQRKRARAHYPVASLESYRFENNELAFKVCWKGDHSTTWEPFEHIVCESAYFAAFVLQNDAIVSKITHIQCNHAELSKNRKTTVTMELLGGHTGSVTFKGNNYNRLSKLAPYLLEHTLSVESYDSRNSLVWLQLDGDRRIPFHRSHVDSLPIVSQFMNDRPKAARHCSPQKSHKSPHGPSASKSLFLIPPIKSNDALTSQTFCDKYNVGLKREDNQDLLLIFLVLADFAFTTKEGSLLLSYNCDINVKNVSPEVKHHMVGIYLPYLRQILMMLANTSQLHQRYEGANWSQALVFVDQMMSSYRDADYENFKKWYASKTADLKLDYGAHEKFAQLMSQNTHIQNFFNSDGAHFWWINAENLHSLCLLANVIRYKKRHALPALFPLPESFLALSSGMQHTFFSDDYPPHLMFQPLSDRESRYCTATFEKLRNRAKMLFTRIENCLSEGVHCAFSLANKTFVDSMYAKAAPPLPVTQ